MAHTTTYLAALSHACKQGNERWILYQVVVGCNDCAMNEKAFNLK